MSTQYARVKTQYTTQSLLHNSLLNYQIKGNYSNIEYVNTLSSRVYTQYTTQSLLNNCLLNYQPIGNYSNIEY